MEPVGENWGAGTMITKQWTTTIFSKTLNSGEVTFIWIAPPCGVHSRLSRQGKTEYESKIRKRIQDEKQREQIREVIIPLMEIIHRAKQQNPNIIDIWENPEGNLFWNTRAWRMYHEKHGGETIVTDYCTKGCPMKKPMRISIMSKGATARYLGRALKRNGLGTRCAGDHIHKVQSIGKEGKATEHYPQAICEGVAKAIGATNNEIEKIRRKCRIARAEIEKPKEESEYAIVDTAGHATCIYERGVLILKDHGYSFTTSGMGEIPGKSTFEVHDVAVTSNITNKQGEEEEVVLILHHVGVNDDPSQCGILDPYQVEGKVHPMLQHDGTGARIELNTGDIINLQLKRGDTNLKYKPATAEDMTNLRKIPITPDERSRRRLVLVCISLPPSRRAASSA